jgi:glycosyltransferase involved in cell wall biosynthesis
VAEKLLLLVENISVPSDRRVWPECLSLRDAGYDVTVVCPQGNNNRDRELFEVCAGVEIYRYSLPPASGGRREFLWEYLRAFWHTWTLVRKLARTRTFSVVHAANPPDILLIAASPLKRRGTRFIFDHHDLVPELYADRFGRKGVLYWLSRLMALTSFRLADVVIATNESYRRIAIERGRKRPEDVFVVRNGPDLSQFHPVDPDPSLKRGKPHLIAYVGDMAPQDGIDCALRSLASLRRLRDDWHAIFVGGGDVFEEVVTLARKLALDDIVEFAGVLPTEDVVRILSTADVCLAPELKTAFNDASTMIKIAEYMDIGRSIVAYDLTESRFTAGDAALYAVPNNEEDFAQCVHRLLEDPALRASMGDTGRRRVGRGFAWSDSEPRLLAAYEHVLSNGRRPT